MIDPDALCGALRVTRKGLAEALRPELEAAYAELAPPAGAAFDTTTASVGRRALRNVCLAYLSKLDGNDAVCKAQVTGCIRSRPPLRRHPRGALAWRPRRQLPRALLVPLLITTPRIQLPRLSLRCRGSSLSSQPKRPRQGVPTKRRC